MACMVFLKHAPNRSDSNFVLIFRNLEVSRSMRSLEWIRLSDTCIMQGRHGGCRVHSSHSPDFLKGQCTYEIGVLDSRKVNC